MRLLPDQRGSGKRVDFVDRLEKLSQPPVALSMIARARRITIVRTKVAKSDPIPDTPTLAKMAVNAAKQAERMAQNCQEKYHISHCFLLLAGVRNCFEIERLEFCELLGALTSANLLGSQ